MTIKKLHIQLTLLTGLCLSALAMGCSDDNISPALSGDDDLQAVELESFTCKKEPLIETGLGTSFDNKMNMVWSEDDSLLVFVENGQERDSAWFVASDIKGTSSSNFRNPEGKTLKGTRFTFVYNKDNATGITYEQFGVVSGLRIPQMQQKMKNNFDPKAAPMVGVFTADKETTDWSVTMKPVCSFVKYAPAKKATFSRIELTCSNGASLSSSNLKVDCSGSDIIVTPQDEIHSVTLTGEENQDTTYIAVLPVKVGQSLIAMLSNDPWKKGYYCEQMHLGDDYAFVRNTRHNRIKFNIDSTQIWQKLDAIRLLRTNFSCNDTIVRYDTTYIKKDSIRIDTVKIPIGPYHFTWKESQQYLKDHPGLRTIEHKDFFNSKNEFFYKQNLHYDPDLNEVYISWKESRYNFPLQGFQIQERDTTYQDKKSSRTWIINEDKVGYLEFDRNKNVNYKPESRDTMKYNLRLKIPY